MQPTLPLPKMAGERLAKSPLLSATTAPTCVGEHSRALGPRQRPFGGLGVDPRRGCVNLNALELGHGNVSRRDSEGGRDDDEAGGDVRRRIGAATSERRRRGRAYGEHPHETGGPTTKVPKPRTPSRRLGPRIRAALAATRESTTSTTT